MHPALPASAMHSNGIPITETLQIYKKVSETTIVFEKKCIDIQSMSKNIRWFIWKVSVLLYLCNVIMNNGYPGKIPEVYYIQHPIHAEVDSRRSDDALRFLIKKQFCLHFCNNNQSINVLQL